MPEAKLKKFSKLHVNKHQRIPKGQSNMDTAEKLATQSTHVIHGINE